MEHARRRSPLGDQPGLMAALIAAWAGILIYFYGFHRVFLLGQAAGPYWVSSWNARTEYEHAFLIPPIILFLLIWKRREIGDAMRRGEGSWLGMPLTLFGILFYVVAVRAVQWRLAAFALPCLLLGPALFIWGWSIIRWLWFPCALLAFTVPLHGALQTTNALQLISTKAAYHVASSCGVDLQVAGNQISSATDKWGFEVSEGCSGLRSLVALMLVAALYAYFTQKSLGKGLLIFLSSIPLAMFANAVRITTIVLIAEYIHPGFAGGVYHDWAGFAYFIVVGLLGLIGVHFLLDGGRGKVSRRQVTRPAASPAPP